MAQLSPTLRMRLKAYEARKKNTEDSVVETVNQKSIILKYKEMLELALKQELGTKGLNLCILTYDNTDKFLVVNIQKFNELKSMLDIDAFNLHALCVLESLNVNDSQEKHEDLYSTSNISKQEYCTFLGQEGECKLDQIYESV